MTDLEAKWEQDILDAKAKRIADKKERRAVRHDIQQRARQLIQKGRQGFCTTNQQIKANSKLITERYLKAQSEMR